MIRFQASTFPLWKSSFVTTTESIGDIFLIEFGLEVWTIASCVSETSETGSEETTGVEAVVSAEPVTEVSEAQETDVQVSNPNSIKKMSPMLSVVVTNELFHNGNVEAWKRIMNSYTTKYPDLQIWVYYDGEQITDINALFKWGKVKHGSCIQFVVVGEEIKDVPKLKRYFTQGASPMFEAFLQGAPGAVLNLF